MLNWLKRILIALVGLVIIAVLTIYVTLRQSLPTLDGDRIVSKVTQPATLSRDTLGQAVIQAGSRNEAMYLLGFAHGQDRFFQMDLQRRVAAGELSEWLGEMAVDVDKANRFHQFRQRAENIVASLPEDQQARLQAYADGVNQAISEAGARPFEYLLTQFDVKPWSPADSLLVIYSMYLDLQGGTLKRDLALTAIARRFGQPMVDFILQSSQYQAALDGSQIRQPASIPSLTTPGTPPLAYSTDLLDFSAEIGSNNWIVDGSLTKTGDALLASDMHLGLRIPTTWYRVQLNYTHNGIDVQLNGLSLPGVPALIAGTNGHIAWGFTNGYIDTADWVKVAEDDVIKAEETLIIKGEPTRYTRLDSKWGPVKQVGDNFYALQWTAHQPYAINLALNELDTRLTVLESLPIVRKLGMPVQNIAIGDTKGNIAWMLAGTVPARTTPQDTATTTTTLEGWEQQNFDLPVVMNPDSHRIWTANSRVMSSDDVPVFGDGGYALGARAMQIRDRLFDYANFDESRFYQIQLDNEARFLQPWHALLKQLLQRNSGNFAADLAALDSWGNCACADSVGYTLVSRFRSQLISTVFSPVSNELKQQDLSFGPLVRYLEPAIWQLIRRESPAWLPEGEDDWQRFMLSQYQLAKQQLQETYGSSPDLSDLNWGKVNALTLKHPFAAQIPFVGSSLNMPQVPAFGDTFMPAVQKRAFGASQRLFVRPGHLDQAVLTVPGGQSGHPLSPFYKAGFSDYANQRMTPLLPGTLEHTITFMPSNQE